MEHIFVEGSKLSETAHNSLRMEIQRFRPLSAVAEGTLERRVRQVTIEYEEVPVPGPQRTHENFGPRLPRSHDSQTMSAPREVYDPINDLPPYDPDHGDSKRD